ncbi:hypothetical protein [Actinacidiphila sp. ITFR-21]|uniref:hypothetical protein n=1 Tax=Actinacidiphila sp. ITFR-21 TaxID=3075199 RepID=UPI00288B0F17|nr:hypothetical protein [Streptomyces sp. ITFR-21]WNI16396.1 hypothetical protein RLT57_13315 [Streptomyces sp. ITFR-21]
MPELQGRDALLRRLVPRLVGIQYRADGRRQSVEYQDAGPVVLLVGSRGTGKSAVLADLADAYRQRVPLSFLDLASPDLRRPRPWTVQRRGPDADGLGGPPSSASGAGGESDGSDAADANDQAANTSPVTDLLYTLEHDLRRRPKYFGVPLEFPRLIHGLVAVSGWQAGSPQERTAALQRLDGQLTADRGNTAGLIQAGLEAVIDGVGTLTGEESLAAAAKTLVPTLTQRLFGRRVNKVARRWWADREVAPTGDGLDQLAALAVDFRDTEGNGRLLAHRHLVAALLDDVSAHYGPMRRYDGIQRPLVLLDNAEPAGLGGDFLELLLQARHEYTGDSPSQLVVVLTAAGDEAAHPSADAVERHTGWRSPDPDGGADPESWLLSLGLWPLREPAIRAMFGASRPPARLVRVVERVSGGRAGVAHALVHAALPRLEGGEALDPSQLLDLSADGRPGTGTKASARLLRFLVPEEAARRRLTYYSPALDASAAAHLSRNFPPEWNGPLAANATALYLRLGHWRGPSWPGTDGPFVGDRTLRTLLLHELRGTPSAWDAVHRQLLHRLDTRHPLESGAVTSDVRYLHHALAMGDCDVVVRSLHQLFRQGSDAGAARVWLAALNLVCAAPRPPRRVPAGSPARCPACGSDGLPVHQAIDVLVRDLWALSAPEAVPDKPTVDRITLGIGVLATHSVDTAQDVYFAAYNQWPQQLEGWVQAPDLALPGGAFA